jgi:hypothetical protein
MTDTFFHKLATLGMSEPEIALHELRIERQALVARATEYHKHRAQSRAMEDYPLGYCRRELDAVNTAIRKAVADLHRFRAANLKPGERLHLNVHKTNLGA